MPGPTQPEALVGAVLNRRYRLLRVLGEGGLGVVYEAEDASAARAAPVAGHPEASARGSVAVKLLRAEFCSDPEVVERFLSEAALSGRIQHPDVIRSFGAERAEDGSPYVVMELLAGQPLSTAMNRGRLAVEQASHVAMQLLDALAAAHAQGVVHRDIKPDNVFLCPQAAGPPAVKLLDFGISRVVEAAGGAGRKTRTGMLLGTPGYMSAEQVKNPKDVDHRSDLFSAGVLLFEMLTAERAFEAGTDFERVTAVLHRDPKSLASIAPHFAHWDPFFRRALAREPGDRFQSAEEMKLAVQSVATSGRLPETGTGRFGGDDTAVSPGHSGAPAAPSAAPPAVQVVAIARRPLVLPWWVALGGAVVAFVVGCIVGWWLA